MSMSDLSTQSAAAVPVRRGRVLAIDADGAVVVDLESDLLTCDRICGSDGRPTRVDIGESVVVVTFAGESRGVVLGRLATPAIIAEWERADAARDEAPDTLVLEAKESLTLRVGDGAITIRADGKILIKGKDLVSHAKNVNRIKGGAVSIN